MTKWFVQIGIGHFGLPPSSTLPTTMTRFALLLALLPAALAFKDTVPIVAWSSRPYAVHYSPRRVLC